MYCKEIEIENKGYQDALYGYSYLDPYWTKEELQIWSKGYKRGLKEKETGNYEPFQEDE